MSLKAELSNWENISQPFQTTPNGGDTQTLITGLAQVGHEDWMVIGFHVSRNAGNVSRILFETDDIAAIALMDFPFDAPAAAFAQFDIPRGIRAMRAREQFGMNAKIFHSATASGLIKLTVNYWVRVATF